MNTSSTPNPEPIAGDVHEVIRDVLRDGFPQEIVDALPELWGRPHRLSRSDIVARVEAMRDWQPERVLAGLQQIADEDELYRFGFDCGVEAGFADAVEEMNRHLESVRPQPPRPSGAPIEDAEPESRGWIEFGGAVIDLPDSPQD